MSVIGKCLTAKPLLLIMNRAMSLQSTPPVLLPLKARGAVSMVSLGVFQTNGVSTVFNPSKELLYPVCHQIFFERECEQASTDKLELVEMCINNS